MKNNRVIDLLDQIIEKSRHEDFLKKIKEPTPKNVGESWITFHLKALKELLIEEEKG